MADVLISGASTGLSNFAQLSSIIHHEPGGSSVALWAFGVLMVVKTLGNETGGMFAAYEAQVWPGMGPPPHSQSEADETWVLLEGDMTWYVGDKVVDAKPGTFLFLPKFRVHSWRVNQNKCARMLILFSPGTFGDFFLEAGRRAEPGTNIPVPEGVTPPAATEQEIAKGLELAATKYGIQFDFGFRPADSLASLTDV